jgi:excisionase family DNA binding protein
MQGESQDLFRGFIAMTATQLFSDDAYTIREVASKLDVTRRHVMWLIEQGKLPGSYKFGMLRLIPKQAVEARLRHNKQGKARHAAK